MTLQPGPTLSDSVGLRRIRFLEKCRLNCWMMILQMQEQAQTMSEEIKELERGLI